MARKAMNMERYIDSFRYSFLLMESLYGDGQFRASKLKNAFEKNEEFRTIVERARHELILPSGGNKSDTNELLKKSTPVEEIIDHIVDKRGYYFHGNIRRGKAWKSHEQKEAETICHLSLAIVNLISDSESRSMFTEESWQRYFQDAESKGATMTMQFNYKAYDPVDKEDPNYLVDTCNCFWYISSIK